MAKIILEFDTNEDQYDIYCLYKAKKMKIALNDIYNLARSSLKYKEETSFLPTLEDVQSIAGEFFYEEN